MLTKNDKFIVNIAVNIVTTDNIYSNVDKT